MLEIAIPTAEYIRELCDGDYFEREGTRSCWYIDRCGCKPLEAAKNVGIPPEDITTVVKLSAFIKRKAASHVEHLVETIEKPEVAYGQAVSACC